MDMVNKCQDYYIGQVLLGMKYIVGKYFLISDQLQFPTGGQGTLRIKYPSDISCQDLVW